MKHITLNQLNSFKNKLLEYSLINEQDLQKIFRKVDEKELNNDELKFLKYEYSLPLFCKIIFKLRKEGCCTGLWRSLDPGNQEKVLNYYKMSRSDGYGLLEFLHWIRYSVSPYDLCILEFGAYNEELMNKSSFVEKWEKNEILFFFTLTDEQKESLIKRYNEDCVDAYNEHCRHTDKIGSDNDE